ncbi:MAG TPA: hypothetical protein VGM87_17930 [Roseomonas sp.]
MSRLLHGSFVATALALGLAACAPAGSNPPGTAAQRAYDREAGTNTSGAYPRQSDGRPGNPPGNAVERTYDRNAGTNTSGAYPRQSDGMPGNPPGNAVQRTYDRATDSNTSGAYPQNR